MKVFISWSGQASKAVAVTLRKNLPLVLQGIDFFMSKHDIESGARWAHELAKELDKSSFGILCLTKENLNSPWLLFEAGSLVKHSEGRACGILIGELTTAGISGPLAEFQHRQFEKSEILHLLKDLNAKLERSLSSEELSRLLDKFWPDIEAEYTVALKLRSEGGEQVRRTDRELLEEIVQRIRGVEVEQFRTESDRRTFDGDVLSRPVTVDSVAWYSLWKFPSKPVSDKIQAILLRDLDSTKYRTIEDIDRAVKLASRAVESYERENPDVFKFGTDHITKSIGFVDPEFRSRHGFAAKTLQAFEKYEGLVHSGGKNAQQSPAADAEKTRG